MKAATRQASRAYQLAHRPAALADWADQVDFQPDHCHRLSFIYRQTHICSIMDSLCYLFDFIIVGAILHIRRSIALGSTTSPDGVTFPGSSSPNTDAPD
jgi:hypothetical protein